MGTYLGVEVRVQTFITSAVDSGMWSSFRLQPHCLPVMLLGKRLVAPKGKCVHRGKRKFPRQETKSDHSSRSHSLLRHNFSYLCTSNGKSQRRAIKIAYFYAYLFGG